MSEFAADNVAYGTLSIWYSAYIYILISHVHMPLMLIVVILYTCTVYMNV